ncbi:MAG: DUF1667 domain-containing protein [Clostridia bacterium]|nr:DUF1667 domain-containing protein [Clostridia bacterium]
MSTLVCITCPRGCTLNVEQVNDEWQVTGNSCKKGYEFAINEMTAPKRTICSTVKTTFKNAPVLPCRVSADIPKDRIFDVMKEINKVVVNKPLNRGDVIIENVLGLGVDVISTSNLLTQI